MALYAFFFYGHIPFHILNFLGKLQFSPFKYEVVAMSPFSLKGNNILPYLFVMSILPPSIHFFHYKKNKLKKKKKKKQKQNRIQTHTLMTLIPSNDKHITKFEGPSFVIVMCLLLEGIKVINECIKWNFLLI